MASTSKCPYCGATISSEDKNCPSCGAPNEMYVADTPRTVFFPKTIAELQEYCAERGMPLLKMRFFVGEDYKEPKAFGIYQDGEDFVVYKNKANGERAVRYRGPDEAHAVDELFTKLLEECHNRGIYPDGKPTERSLSGGNNSSGNNSSGNKGTGNKRIVFAIVGLWIVLATILTMISGTEVTYKSGSGGYYKYHDTYYYRYESDWYSYNDYTQDWIETGSFPEDDYADYYVGSDYDSDWGVEDFKSSDYYRETVENNSSSSWDYDSWDSNDTDWDSDW